MAMLSLICGLGAGGSTIIAGPEPPERNEMRVSWLDPSPSDRLACVHVFTLHQPIQHGPHLRVEVEVVNGGPDAIRFSGLLSHLDVSVFRQGEGHVSLPPLPPRAVHATRFLDPASPFSTRTAQSAPAAGSTPPIRIELSEESRELHAEGRTSDQEAPDDLFVIPPGETLRIGVIVREVYTHAPPTRAERLRAPELPRHPLIEEIPPGLYRVTLMPMLLERDGGGDCIGGLALRSQALNIHYLPELQRRPGGAAAATVSPEPAFPAFLLEVNYYGESDVP